MGNPVVHFEVVGKDASGLRKFYSEVFGWRMGDAEGPTEYSMAYPDAESGIQGGVGRAGEGPGHVTFYVSVKDLPSKLDQIERLGGRTVLPPRDVPGGPQVSLFADPEGHVIGLLKE